MIGDGWRISYPRPSQLHHLSRAAIARGAGESCSPTMRKHPSCNHLDVQNWTPFVRVSLFVWEANHHWISWGPQPLACHRRNGTTTACCGKALLLSSVAKLAQQSSAQRATNLRLYDANSQPWALPTNSAEQPQRCATNCLLKAVRKSSSVVTWTWFQLQLNKTLTRLTPFSRQGWKWTHPPHIRPHRGSYGLSWWWPQAELPSVCPLSMMLLMNHLVMNHGVNL